MGQSEMMCYDVIALSIYSACVNECSEFVFVDEEAYKGKKRKKRSKRV